MADARADSREEGAGAARRLECPEVPQAVCQRVEGVAFTVEPENLPGVAGAAGEQGLVDIGDAAASGPPADEVHHAPDLLGVLAGIRHAENAAARLPADHDPVPIHEGHGEDRGHRGFDVPQGAIRSRDRAGGIAGVAGRANRLEALVVLPSEPPRPRRAGMTTAHPRWTKNWARAGKSISREKRRGSTPLPVEPWLKTRVGAGPPAVGR